MSSVAGGYFAPKDSSPPKAGAFRKRAPNDSSSKYHLYYKYLNFNLFKLIYGQFLNI